MERLPDLPSRVLRVCRTVGPRPLRFPIPPPFHGSRRAARGFLRAFLPAITRVVLLSGLACAPSRAEHLPIKTYTIADGLARDHVRRIVQDSRGFIWFCTSEGLSRFDGYAFTSYSVDHGLPHRHVSDLLESRDGTYWVATWGGLCVFNPTGTARDGRPTQYFTVHPLAGRHDTLAVYALAEDSSGAVWCGTHRGLFRLVKTGTGWRSEEVGLDPPGAPAGEHSVHALLFDRQGTLWIGAEDGLLRRREDGRTDHYTAAHGLPTSSIRAVREDHEGRIWVSSWFGGLCRIVPQPEATGRIVERTFTPGDGLPDNTINTICASSRRTLWLGHHHGLSEFDPATGAVRVYTKAHGLSDDVVGAITEDRDGNLWIGTESGGAMKLARNGFVTYNESDGLGSERIASMFENRAGEFYVVDMKASINRFDGSRFTAVHPALPAGLPDPNWEWYLYKIQDRRGDWWIPTGNGVFRFRQPGRFEQLARTPPAARYARGTGLADQVFRLYEDRNGDVWIGSLDSPDLAFFRWTAATGSFRNFSRAEGVPGLAPSAFRDDSLGNLWVGFYSGGLARFRDGRFTRLSAAPGTEAGTVRDIYIDRAGRLWAATALGGVFRVDGPAGDSPRVTVYTAAQGLSSNDARCITEDGWGRIYIGTGRGIDRLDPETGRIRHFAPADGLAGTELTYAYRDRRGELWFGTKQGLSRLAPGREAPAAPPPIAINGFRIAGVRQTVSELGEEALSGYELNPDQNNLQIGYGSVGFRIGEKLLYQYRLEGAEAEWSQPTSQQTVNYASLSPGVYRFLVRAVNSEGIVSERPATIAFRVIPPFWLRWWFIGACFAALAMALVLVHRLRVQRLLAIEKMRRRIATDLHDDVGADLTQIAIFSEILKPHVSDGTSQEMLEKIGTTARGVIAGMSDLVWYIDPRHDTVVDLVARVEDLAGQLLRAKEIALAVDIEPAAKSLSLSPDTRRELFLILKEALNNAVRHASCSMIAITMSASGGALHVTLKDNGRGISAEAVRMGHGLQNMKTRAEALGGRFVLESSPGNGTALSMRIPLAGQPRRTT